MNSAFKVRLNKYRARIKSDFAFDWSWNIFAFLSVFLQDCPPPWYGNGVMAGQHSLAHHFTVKEYRL